MSLRQAAAGILRRLHYRSPSVTATSLGRTTNSLLNPGKRISSCQYDSGDHTWGRRHGDAFQWIFVSGQAVLFLGLNASLVMAEDVSIDLSSENDTNGANVTGLRKVEDGSVVSNLHTSKWRVFTDNGRDFFLQGKLEQAERLFVSALQEAKEGFGERDPHVASACNNLAELYRVRKAYDKAEPLYLEAINILEESFGPDDIRVGAALHNLGKFFLGQRKLEEARVHYERALKIKRCVLGENHLDYADTMYHLGTVLYLQGKERDSEALIKDSVRILEEGGQGESITCIRRLRYLAQIYIKSNHLADAENVHRKILHMMEISKGWNSLDTVSAAERLALTLHSIGSLKEAQDLLERCLEARREVLPEDHIQIAANMLHIARVEILNSNQLRKTSFHEAIAELDKAKDLLRHAMRIARKVLDRLMKQKQKQKGNTNLSREIRKDGHAALVILLQSLNALGLLEINKVELLEPREDQTIVDAKTALHQCISVYKEFESERILSNSPEVKAEYLSCLRHLSALLSNSAADSTQRSRGVNLQELKDEIKHIEDELSPSRKSRSYTGR